MDMVEKQIQGLGGMIGNTPIIEISLKYKGENRLIYAKAEYYNYTGSIKDRMAFHILKKAHSCGRLKPGNIIVEATSGNTGISFSAIASLLGYKVLIYMPDWMSQERVRLMESFGAEVRLISKEQGGYLGCIKLTEEYSCNCDNVFLPGQFTNEDNCESHYLTTGPEIWKQLQDNGIMPDAVVAGVGTGGTIMGTGKYLKEKNPSLKIHPLEPCSSPTLSTGLKCGSHRIQGISDEFIPEILKLNELDEIIGVDDGDAIIMAQMLSKKFGLGLGISSGANFLGALKAQDLLGGKGNVVTLFADDNKKYLSTDLMKTEQKKDGYLTNNIELTGLRSFK